MSTGKIVAKIVGGFFFVSVVTIVAGVIIAFGLKLNPFTVGRYLGLAIVILAVIYGGTLIVTLSAQLRGKGKKIEHEETTR